MGRYYSQHRCDWSTHFLDCFYAEKGKIKVKDPNSIIRSNVLWDFETFDDQIEACWYFSKK